MFASFSSQLLSTKFNKPFLRPAIVNRQQLVDKLDKGIQQKMSLVSGPAGSGKSTILSIWLSKTPVTSAWLSLDETDDEPRRFPAYLTEALRTLSPDIPQDSDGILGAGGKIDTQAFTRSLILPVLSELTHDCILVLDDIHLIGNKKIVVWWIDPSNSRKRVSNSRSKRGTTSLFRFSKNIKRYQSQYNSWVISLNAAFIPDHIARCEHAYTSPSIKPPGRVVANRKRAGGFKGPGQLARAARRDHYSYQLLF